MPKTGRSLVGMVAGFIPEWWPVLDRNGGRLHVGIRTAVTFVGPRAASASSHGRGVTFLRNSVPTIALAPRIRSALRYLSPPLLILPIRSFFPLACILGVSPSQAAMCRADWELTTVSHSCDDSARSDGPYAWCSLQPATVFVVLMPLDNLSFDSSDLFFKHIDVIELSLGRRSLAAGLAALRLGAAAALTCGSGLLLRRAQTHQPIHAQR